MRSLLLAALLTAAAAPALAADPVEGDWLVPAGNSKVRIAPCPGHADQLCGAISWLKAPTDAAGAPKRDTHNPDPALRSRPLLGLNLIRDFKKAPNGRWTGGKIYDPTSGKTYASKIGLNPDGTLKVEGCVAILCQAQTWRR